MNKIFGFLIIWILSSPFLGAQIPADVSFDSPSDISQSPTSETVSLSGKIVPLPPKLDGKAAEYLTTLDQTPVAFLVVRGEMTGRHLYSLTQPKVPGGYQTTIDVTPVEDDSFTIGPFVTASEIVFEEFMGETLEKLEERFTAIAPIYPRKERDASALSDRLAELKWKGNLDALCCDDSNCQPVKKSFPFVFDAEDNLSAALVAADETATILNERTKQASPVKEERESQPNETLAISEIQSLSTARNLFYAFFGGMILNIMPCVLPVIGLKIVSFFEQAGQNRSRAFFLNVCYSIGILSVFTVLALMSVGLSYLFTYGLFQIVMGGIVFVMALNLMGVWEITLPAFLGGKESNRLMQKEGGLGAWFKGIITTLLAIPCGAPLLSPALVWTDAMMKEGSIVSVLMVYWVIGLGMAAPFLIIGAFPELLKFLPKPGLWMETFRNVMGFILLTAIVWILYSMPLELILPMTTFLFALWFACWFLGRNQFDADRRHRRRAWFISVSVVFIVYLLSFNLPLGVRIPTLENAFQSKLTKWGIRAERNGLLTQETWGLFDKERFESDLASGKTVMIDFTADWCMNCKVLESTVLHSREILDLVKEKGIVTMTGDWTNRDDSAESRDVGELLRRYGGEQVPVLMIFSPDRPGDPIILRGIFTKTTLIETLGKLN